MADPRHAETNVRVELGGAGATVTGPIQAPVHAVDNAMQAALADKERTFTVGGDDPAAGRGRDAGATPRPTPLLDRALARLRTPDRPSPFGVAQFPPLPAPPPSGRR